MVASQNRCVSGNPYSSGCWPSIAQTMEVNERGGARITRGGRDARDGVTGIRRAAGTWGTVGRNCRTSGTRSKEGGAATVRVVAQPVQAPLRDVGPPRDFGDLEPERPEQETDGLA